MWAFRLCLIIYATLFGLVFVAFGLAVMLLVLMQPMLAVSFAVRRL